MEYKFFGSNNCDVSPINEIYMDIDNPKVLYDYLLDIWSIDTCAPRLRKDWSENNKTLGQCSITAFLVQDIFGGEVYGVLLDDGAFHCYNVIGKAKFDLTSEQFLGKQLDYNDKYPQSREKHFSDKDKFERYLLLKSKLLKVIRGI